MNVTLRVVAGPHADREFVFDARDTFLVGRTKDSHLRLSYDDPYFSRRHFLLEVNPPRCRLLDLNSRNGVRVNGSRVSAHEVRDGDEIAAGHTVFRVAIALPEPGEEPTLGLPAAPPADSATEPVEPPDPGRPEIPGYAVGRLLGRGGMGQVFRATRAADGAEVAIKTLLPAAGATRRQIDKFLREARLLSGLRHQHIVAFTEVGEAGSVLFLAMELVRGPDAGKLLAERGPLAVKVAVRLVMQVLSGLAHAHERGVVHRDVKPANVLIRRGPGRSATAKLADFGLARVYEASQISGLTVQGDIGGTPAFLPPEHITHFRDVGPPADQYAAAATLYTLLTGKYVHDLPDGVARRIVHIATEDPVPMRERDPRLPAGLAEAVHRALRREPADRYSSVKAFARAIREWA